MDTLKKDFYLLDSKKKDNIVFTNRFRCIYREVIEIISLILFFFIGLLVGMKFEGVLFFITIIIFVLIGKYGFNYVLLSLVEKYFTFDVQRNEVAFGFDILGRNLLFPIIKKNVGVFEIFFGIMDDNDSYYTYSTFVGEGRYFYIPFTLGRIKKEKQRHLESDVRTMLAPVDPEESKRTGIMNISETTSFAVYNEIKSKAGKITAKEKDIIYINYKITLSIALNISAFISSDRNDIFEAINNFRQRLSTNYKKLFYSLRFDYSDVEDDALVKSLAESRKLWNDELLVNSIAQAIDIVLTRPKVPAGDGKPEERYSSVEDVKLSVGTIIAEVKKELENIINNSLRISGTIDADPKDYYFKISFLSIAFDYIDKVKEIEIEQQASQSREKQRKIDREIELNDSINEKKVAENLSLADQKRAIGAEKLAKAQVAGIKDLDPEQARAYGLANTNADTVILGDSRGVTPMISPKPSTGRISLQVIAIGSKKPSVLKLLRTKGLHPSVISKFEVGVTPFEFFLKGMASDQINELKSELTKLGVKFS